MSSPIKPERNPKYHKSASEGLGPKSDLGPAAARGVRKTYGNDAGMMEMVTKPRTADDSVRQNQYAAVGGTPAEVQEAERRNPAILKRLTVSQIKTDSADVVNRLSAMRKAPESEFTSEGKYNNEGALPAPKKAKRGGI